MKHTDVVQTLSKSSTTKSDTFELNVHLAIEHGAD